LVASVLLAPWVFSGCAFVHHYDAQCGWVFDADTGEPIEGAAVVGLYHTKAGSPGGDVSRWAATQETVTDADGEFCLPAKTIFEPRPPLSWFDDYVEVWVFKPLYTVFDGDRAWARLLQTRDTPKGTITEYPLKRVDSIEERKRILTTPGILHHDNNISDSWDVQMPYWFKLYNEESRNLGLEEIKPSGGKR
jgi:hypothetical protein